MANVNPKAKILTGPRAVVFIGEKQVGMFSSITWSASQEKFSAFILGRFNAAELTPVGQEPIRASLTGYRIMDAGPYAVANATHLADLLNENDFILKIQDRQTGKIIVTITECKVTNWSSGINARSVSDIRIDVMGLRIFDESDPSGNKSDDTNGSVLP